VTNLSHRDADVWKAFDQNEITHSGAHYLMAIHDLTVTEGRARVSDIARALNVTRGSASLALKGLREKELADQDRSRCFHLTENGERIVQKVRARRAIFDTFLRDILHVSEQQANTDACKIEHLISAETSDRMLVFIQFLLSRDPETRQFLGKFWNFENAQPDAPTSRDDTT